ncbi:hypothetical protein Ahy_B03g068003 [Arachis hypogaea]|uniref:Uncharacterized protein n=1 Tax=Arachis hypogaea TaxID=3818 RepID=A0A445A8K7_ARAHY|nr:hypothetical protein Ahy_B03g068003 [Arachis hypogaea]
MRICGSDPRISLPNPQSDPTIVRIRSDGSADRIISAKFGSDADNYRGYADIIRSMCSPTEV